MPTASERAKLRHLAARWGVNLATEPVCEGHSAPVDFLHQQIVTRDPMVLWCGPRGGGKSFVSALGTYLDSRMHERHGTRILGGSLAQSEQIYEAMKSFEALVPRGRSPLESFTKRLATFKNGSEVALMAASPTSVRGPHVQRLKLDEVDEIDEDIRESSLGVCMEIRGIPASVVMTSTWHKVGGPMAGLMERGRAGEFPCHTFCMFEVLERCPDSRSGKHLERCPECPLMQWCHEGRDRHPKGLPKAKRSNGHYAIDALIQKVKAVSLRVFESDYLCLRPKASGVWFTKFDRSRHVGDDAEYDPMRPVHLAVDSGVCTGGVWLQTKILPGGIEWRDATPIKRPDTTLVNVFADYYAEGLTAEENARAILRITDERCGSARSTGRLRFSTDQAGGARNPVGPTVLAEYQRAGLVGNRGIETWPAYPGSVEDGLQFIEALLMTADGEVCLRIHPRCVHLINALESYVRAKLDNQWLDYPKAVQHPAEDLVDPLRGGLKTEFPESRKPKTPHGRAPAGRVF